MNENIQEQITSKSGDVNESCFALLEVVNELRVALEDIFIHETIANDCRKEAARNAIRKASNSVITEDSASQESIGPLKGYSREDIVSELLVMNYHDKVAHELADWIAQKLHAAFHTGLSAASIRCF